MSIDYLAMPGIESDTSQRGAELITLHPDSSWDLEQIPLAVTPFDAYDLYTGGILMVWAGCVGFIRSSMFAFS